MLSRPTLIISILLIACSIGLFYFLAIPNFEEISIQGKEIEKLEKQLENTTNYFNEINRNADKLNDLNWNVLEKKIDSNFMSGPFYDYNMNIFIENLIADSGLLSEDITIAGNSSSSEEETQSNNIPIQEEGEMNTETNINSELKKVNLSLTLCGDYSNLKEFLNSLSRQFCIIDINNIKIEEYSSSEGGQSSPEGGSGNIETKTVNGNNTMKFLLEGNIYSK